MKKKFGLWLNIVTICLCVCAIMVGVYAATSATLTVSGQIGFEAHGVEMTIEGKLLNYVLETEQDTATQVRERTLNTVTLGGEAKATTGTMSFADSTGTESGTDVYFTDLVLDENGDFYNIELTLNFSNTSEFAVRAKVTMPTIPNTYKMTATPSTTSDIIMDAKTGTGTLTITFALTDTENSFASNLNIANLFTAENPLVKFTKFTGYEDGEYFVDSTTKMLSVYMGHGTEADYQYVELYDAPHEERIQWQAFAVRGTGSEETGYTTKPEFIAEYETENSKTVYTNTVEAIENVKPAETWYSLNGIDMSNVDYTDNTFWFIQKYVTVGLYLGDPEDVNGEHSLIIGQMFNVSTDDGNNYANGSTTSAIYDYVTNAYLTATGISSTDYYTSSIEERTVSETYTVDYPTKGSSQICSFKSKLWLIGDAELGLLNGAAVLTSSKPYPNIKADGIGNTAGFAGGNGASWWLRFPHPGSSYYAIGVDGAGSIHEYTVDYPFGVRAAFEITIPA